MADLHVSPEGLRTTAGALAEHSEASALGIASVSGAASQTSISAVHGIASHMSGWHLDESGYHAALTEALTSASHGYESTDEQGGRRIGGVM
ncbi:hypothetical protein ABIA30_004063 [Mycobacterium sp. MAA66]|uniref:hypothetical protein n=1 Tax=Mycobacterium sp. MAA66 TaxID=3156297 RepID=UPI003517184E